MKNKISKILCFSSLLMIGGNKVLSVEDPKEEGGPKEDEKGGDPKEEGEEPKGDKEVPKDGEKGEVPKGGEKGDPKEDEVPKDGDGGPKLPKQQQGGGNGEDFETLKKNVDEIEKNAHPEGEKITLVQFCSGQK